MEGGRGPGSTQRARATPKPRSLANARAGPRDFGQLPCEGGKVQGLAACGLEVHPPAGSHVTAVPPAAAARCRTRERPVVPPEFFTLFPKRVPVLRGCREEQLFWRSPTQKRMARGATSGTQVPSIYSSHLCGLQELKTLHPLFLVLQLVLWFTGGEQLSGEVKHQLVNVDGCKLPLCNGQPRSWPGPLFGSLRSRKGRTAATTASAGRCAKLKTLKYRI